MKNIEIVVIILIKFAILVNCKSAKVKDMFFREAGSRVSDLHPNCSYPCHTVNYFLECHPKNPKVTHTIVTIF